MSTRSHIGIINKDGSIEVVYCHHDGYLEFTGKRLLDNHNSVPSVRELLKIGNMTFVGAAMRDADVNDSMMFDNLTDYQESMAEHFTDIEYFYLYAVNRTAGWWVSNNGKDWKQVSELLDNKQ
jgi:hypothetical protein